MPMTIRRIQSEDYTDMIALLKYIPLSRYKVNNHILIGEPDKEKWDKFFQMIPTSSIGYVLCDEEGVMHGLVLGMLVGSFWDSNKIGRIIVWFIEEKYRGIQAIRLMSYLLSWFKQQSVDYIVTSCDFNSQASKVYKKLGFKPLEEILYLKEV